MTTNRGTILLPCSPVVKTDETGKNLGLGNTGNMYQEVAVVQRHPDGTVTVQRGKGLFVVTASSLVDFHRLSPSDEG